MFEDRRDAGAQLADLLDAESVAADIVLGIPRGALPVARPVSDRLDAPLDIIAAKKMGMPGNPEFAVGAAAADGSAWIDEEAVEKFDVDESYLNRERKRAAATAQGKLDRYRGERPGPDLSGERVVVVDDGVATGATARACLRQVNNADAARAVLAVPVGPSSSLSELEHDADAVYAVEEPDHFRAVGQFYRNFSQVTDDEAMEYLAWSAPVD